MTDAMVGIMASRGRLVIVPLDNSEIFRVENPDAALIRDQVGDGADLGEVLLEALSYQPRELGPRARSGDNYRKQSAERRGWYNRAFGVGRQSDWLSDARNLVVSEIHPWLVFWPLHRDSLRSAQFIFGGPDEAVCAHRDDGPQVLADALAEALTRCTDTPRLARRT